MKIKLLLGSVVSLFGLIIALPALAAIITISDPGCASFITGGTASSLTVTCAPVDPPADPPADPPSCSSLTATPSTIEEGGSSTLQLTCIDGPTSYAWTPTPAASAVRTVSPETSTTYSVLASNSEGADPGGALSVDVTVTPAAAPPSCSPSAFPASITSGQSTTLNANCTGATSYTWSSSTGGIIPSIATPTVSPTEETTYTLIAGNTFNTTTGTVLVPVSAPVVLATFSCGAGLTVNNVSVQRFYQSAGDAFNVRMGEGEAYSMSFTTGMSSAQLQTVDIVEWSGSPAFRDVTISEAPCNYTSTALARVFSDKPNIPFTVGIPKSKSFIRPDLLYPLLKPNTVYYVNLRNRHPITGASTCGGSCGFNFKFFGSVP